MTLAHAHQIASTHWQYPVFGGMGTWSISVFAAVINPTPDAWWIPLASAAIGAIVMSIVPLIGHGVRALAINNDRAKRYLRHRVNELERENERLRKQAETQP